MTDVPFQLVLEALAAPARYIWRRVAARAEQRAGAGRAAAYAAGSVVLVLAYVVPVLLAAVAAYGGVLLARAVTRGA